MEMKLPVRFYQATPTSNPVGLVEEEWTLDTSRTAFVSLHCWNVGCPGGPPVPEEYWVALGAPQNHVLGWCVLTDYIVPALDAARQIKMPVVHVEPERIGDKYKDIQPPIPKTDEVLTSDYSPVGDHGSRRANRVHGEGFMDWAGWDELDIAEPVKPIAGEPMIVTTSQFDAWLRERNIDTLIYVGFTTNLCILGSPAALQAMSGRGYKCILLREGTLAVEFPETIEQRINTQVALRYIECWVGYTASVADFLRSAGKQ